MSFHFLADHFSTSRVDYNENPELSSQPVHDEYVQVKYTGEAIAQAPGLIVSVTTF